MKLEVIEMLSYWNSNYLHFINNFKMKIGFSYYISNYYLMKIKFINSKVSVTCSILY